MSDKQTIMTAIECGISDRVKLTREHREMIESIAEVWLTNPGLARKMERAFVAICNGETHD